MDYKDLLRELEDVVYFPNVIVAFYDDATRRRHIRANDEGDSRLKTAGSGIYNLANTHMRETELGYCAFVDWSFVSLHNNNNNNNEQTMCHYRALIIDKEKKVVILYDPMAHDDTRTWPVTMAKICKNHYKSFEWRAMYGPQRSNEENCGQLTIEFIRGYANKRNQNLIYDCITSFKKSGK